MCAANILFILSDQHAHSMVGAHGNPWVSTPNLDRLVARGKSFSNCYTPSPLCVPARMSLLTGMLPSHTGCFTNSDTLASDIPTYAHALGAAGYRTVQVGRLHSIGPDQLRGFQTRLVGDHSSNWIGAKGHDMGPLADTTRPHGISLARSGRGHSVYESHDRDVTDAALAQLDRLGADDDDRPFLLHVGYILPHQPYVAAPELVEKYLNILPATVPSGAVPDHPYFAWWRDHSGLCAVTAQDTRRALAAYYALVEVMDAMIGELLDRLHQTGLDEDTLVIYASDHGEMMGNKGLWWKQCFFEDAARVPLIMSRPGHVAPGTSDQICSLCDLSATMIDLAGVLALPFSDGHSLCPVLDGGGPVPRDVLSEYYTDGLARWPGRRQRFQRMLRRDHWKYIHFDDAPPMLFDLQADPQEDTNLAGQPEHAAREAEMHQSLMQDWDPAQIAGLMDRRAARKDLLKTWARATSPQENHVWTFEADDNILITT
ncbi:sulfatase-like hydrolase/transferase [Phaeobacter sp. J2-8]|uniref:sulfatase-like hydrolase/transferase n=1 Tax=Phaeobacter sp. J2-8 TaxID=2931394 RepID=UPI001FD22C20|nr:sulfatase-like hydrolase/transferase [Phaeobacter sp. J2-8]MCJ7874100.1 sulfatase-like hydrolase/transferase [Phaeobacter sp. J2-8]